MRLRIHLRNLIRHILIKNPVMFIVGIGAVLTTIIFVMDLVEKNPASFDFQIAVWLWFTVLFANFAEAIAEGRGKAQSENLRKSRTNTIARKLIGKKEVKVSALELRSGDIVVCEVGDLIPADGEVIDGVASVDESAITGESAPVIRESGGDRSAVTGGTKVLSDRIIIRITSNPGETFIDRMISLVEGAKRKKTPNEIALSILLSGLTIVFLIVVVTLKIILQLLSHHFVSGYQCCFNSGINRITRLFNSNYNWWIIKCDWNKRNG